MADKTEMLHDDLNVAFTEVRKVLDYYGLTREKGWTEYLLVRHPEKNGGFIVLAHPDDKSEFGHKLIALHESEIKIPA